MKKIKLSSVDYYKFVALAKYDHMYIGVIGGFVIIQANIIDLARLGF
jgi:hypothetical protein